MFVLIVLLAFVALYSWFIKFVVQDARRQRAEADSPMRATTTPVTEVIVPTALAEATMTWSALDDRQLRRLLDSA